MHNNPKKLNILISCGSYSWGGLEMFSLETAKKLREKGMNIKILCTENSRLSKEAELSGFETLSFFGKNKNASFFKFFRILMADVLRITATF